MNRAGRTSQIVGRATRKRRRRAHPSRGEQLDPTYGLLAGLRDHSSNRIGSTTKTFTATAMMRLVGATGDSR
jgi:CubicO group peptidase (beta-lactamase class C family)